MNMPLEEASLSNTVNAAARFQEEINSNLLDVRPDIMMQVPPNVPGILVTRFEMASDERIAHVSIDSRLNEEHVRAIGRIWNNSSALSDGTKIILSDEHDPVTIGAISSERIAFEPND